MGTSRRSNFVITNLQPSATLIYPLPKRKEEEENNNDNTADNAKQQGDSQSMDQSEQGGCWRYWWCAQAMAISTISGTAEMNYSTTATSTRTPCSCCAMAAMSEKEKKAKEEKAEKEKKAKEEKAENEKMEKKAREARYEFEEYLADGDRKKEFINYLGIDGVLILELIARNSNDIVTSAGKRRASVFISFSTGNFSHRQSVRQVREGGGEPRVSERNSMLSFVFQDK